MQLPKTWWGSVRSRLRTLVATVVGPGTFAILTDRYQGEINGWLDEIGLPRPLGGLLNGLVAYPYLALLVPLGYIAWTVRQAADEEKRDRQRRQTVPQVSEKPAVYDWKTLDTVEPLMSKVHFRTDTATFQNSGSLLEAYATLVKFASEHRSLLDDTVVEPLDAYLAHVSQGIVVLNPSANVPWTIVPRECERRAQEHFQRARVLREEVIKAIREIRRRHGNR